MFLKELLLSKVEYAADGCWLWTGSDNGRGYGKVYWEGKYQVAHRKSYEQFVGPIPNSLFVLHSCDCPSCINPAHLFLGTQKDNMDDMRTKGRENYIGQEGQYNGSAILNDDKVLEIKELLSKGNNSQAEIGYGFGVSQTTISLIKRGLIWKHL